MRSSLCFFPPPVRTFSLFFLFRSLPAAVNCVNQFHLPVLHRSDVLQLHRIQSTSRGRPLHLPSSTASSKLIAFITSRPWLNSVSVCLLIKAVTFNTNQNCNKRLTHRWLLSFYAITDLTGLQSKTVDGLFITLAGLLSFTTYRIRVEALTRIGGGPLSPIVACRTDEAGEHRFSCQFD